MALQLPANFQNDIEGRDTNLIPIVVIGNFPNYYQNDTNHQSWLMDESIILSTNAFHQKAGLGSSEGVSYSYEINALPLLLNIPSLKESIDIEKRNYKISSINLDISNYKYEGKRFSELVAEHEYISKSLLNVECRIFWVSPSIKNISIFCE